MEPLYGMAQKNECSHYVETVTKPVRKKIRQSLYPLDFVVDEHLQATQKMSDRGLPNTIDLMLDFNDRSGLPAALGSTLSLQFVDGTSYSIIARTRKANTSTIYFALNALKKEHVQLIEKLSHVDLRALEITVDDTARAITIPDTKAVIIRRSISCIRTVSEE